MTLSLDLDLGNTRCKWRAVDDGECVDRGVCSLDALNELHSRPGLSPKQIRIACVRGVDTEAELTRWANDGFGIEPIFARTRPSFRGLKVAYQDPSRLGVDRWLAMLAGLARTEGGFCVIDCGSAITIDAVDSTGLHRGGYIVPGMAMMRQSLLRNTDRVRFDEQDTAAETAPGKSTAAAVLNGARVAALGCLERAIREVHHLVQAERCYLTGGDAASLSPDLLFRHELLPDLVLEGLDLAFRGES